MAGRGCARAGHACEAGLAGSSATSPATSPCGSGCPFRSPEPELVEVTLDLNLDAFLFARADALEVYGVDRTASSAYLRHRRLRATTAFHTTCKLLLHTDVARGDLRCRHPRARRAHPLPAPRNDPRRRRSWPSRRCGPPLDRGRESRHPVWPGLRDPGSECSPGVSGQGRHDLLGVSGSLLAVCSMQRALPLQPQVHQSRMRGGDPPYVPWPAAARRGHPVLVDDVVCRSPVAMMIASTCSRLPSAH